MCIDNYELNMQCKRVIVAMKQRLLQDLAPLLQGGLFFFQTANQIP